MNFWKKRRRMAAVHIKNKEKQNKGMRLFEMMKIQHKNY